MQRQYISKSGWGVVIGTGFATTIQYLPVPEVWKSFTLGLSLFILALGLTGWVLRAISANATDGTVVTLACLIGIGVGLLPIVWHQQDRARITLEQLFTSIDFNDIDLLRIQAESESHSAHGGAIQIRVCMDYRSNSKFVIAFIPRQPEEQAISAIAAMANSHDQLLGQIASVASIQTSNPGDLLIADSHELVPTGRVFIYTDTELPLQAEAQLEQLYKERHLLLQLRGHDYLLHRLMQLP